MYTQSLCARQFKSTCKYSNVRVKKGWSAVCQRITLKKAHAIPATIKTDFNKERRRQYVSTCQQVSQYMREGKTIIWVDGTNPNLFCRRSQGRARVGEWTVMAWLAWFLEKLENLPPGIPVDTDVVVCDNAPCHSKFEECMIDNLGLTISSIL